MLVCKAFQFRLKTDHILDVQFSRFAGHCRFLWNKCLRINLDRLKKKYQILRYEELDFWSKHWKNSDEYGFLKECPSQALQQKLMDLNKAFIDAFDPSQPNKRLPRVKKKKEVGSFRYPQGFKIQGNRVFLPKIGWVRFLQSQKIIGTPKNVTISKKSGHWFVSIQTEYSCSQQAHPADSIIGIDMGIAHFATLSTGDFVEGVSSFRAHESRLSKAQRKLSCRRKFSNNWKKQKNKIQRLHRRIAYVRLDYLHKLSTQLSKNHAIIVLEDLKVKNMSGSASGSVELPGTRVKAKSGLNKSILDQGWSEFKRQLTYKQKWRGGEVILVNPRYTSQTCPNPKCGHVSKENRISQSEFKCQQCNYENNADVVGALNVLRAGHAQLACSSNQKLPEFA